MSNYIYDKVGKLFKKYHTRNPFDILEQMNVVVKESSNYHNLKGYCLVSCKTTYVVINSQLSEPEKRIVAAHELGHVVLHRSLMKLAPMMDSTIYDMISKTEYEANLFAADLLLSDTDIEEMSQNEDTREWTVFVVDTDVCTYLYGFCVSPDAAADMGEIYQNIFSQLYLSDEE